MDANLLIVNCNRYFLPHCDVHPSKLNKSRKKNVVQGLGSIYWFLIGLDEWRSECKTEVDFEKGLGGVTD